MSMKMKTIAWLVNKDDPRLWANIIRKTIQKHPGCFRLISDETGFKGVWLKMKVGGTITELDTAEGTLTIHTGSGVEECPMPEKPRDMINKLIGTGLANASNTHA